MNTHTLYSLFEKELLVVNFSYNISSFHLMYSVWNWNHSLLEAVLEIHTEFFWKRKMDAQYHNATETLKTKVMLENEQVTLFMSIIIALATVSSKYSWYIIYHII
jgi:hypothetical protein